MSNGSSEEQNSDGAKIPICRGGRGLIRGEGFKFEEELSDAVRTIIYGLFLGYLFLGVSIVADAFMSAIEAITARKQRVLVKETGRFVTVRVWNDTVANLTLMALGSSAPEILISVLEICKEEFYSGSLGPSTIVGSAAFNLLVIVGVCVVAIPSPELRIIKEQSVFVVTAFFSLLAYAWLLVIVQLSSPDIVEVWEAVTMLLALPVLVLISWMCDAGLLGKRHVERNVAIEPEEGREGTAADLVSEVKTLSDVVPGPSQTHEDPIISMKSAPSSPSSASRPCSRKLGPTDSGEASRSSTGCQSVASLSPSSSLRPTTRSEVSLSQSDKGVVRHESMESVAAAGSSAHVVNVTMLKPGSQHCGSSRNSSKESLPQITPIVNLSALSHGAMKTSVMSSKPVSRQASMESLNGEPTPVLRISALDPGLLVGSPSLVSKRRSSIQTSVRVVQDTMPQVTPVQMKAFGIDEELRDEDGEVIVNSNGVVSFGADIVEVMGSQGELQYTVPVYRQNGREGAVECSWRMERLTAVPGYDYQDACGMVTFKSGQTKAEVVMTILPKHIGERADQFQLILEEITGGAIFNPMHDGGDEQQILTVTIKNANEAKAGIAGNFAHIFDGMVNLDEARLGTAIWAEQISDAAGSWKDATCVQDKVFGIVNVPWRLFYAIFVPPAVYCGGWICFITSLFHIGLLTAIIIDIAELFGCVAGLDNSVTAMTFVALGTSMPDLFASRAAATQDEYADASIVNVTGSNSVNVFLGIGLPWTMAALYWEVAGATDSWIRRYPQLYRKHPTGAFVVKAGRLAFSVSIFGIAAVIILIVLHLRRLFAGGELGGPFISKVASFIFFVLLWLWFVGLYIWNMEADPDHLTQIMFVMVSLLCVLVVVFIVSGLLYFLQPFLSPKTQQPPTPTIKCAIHGPEESDRLSHRTPANEEATAGQASPPNSISLVLPPPPSGPPPTQHMCEPSKDPPLLQKQGTNPEPSRHSLGHSKQCW